MTRRDNMLVDTVSIVIPVYCEEGTIRELFHRVCECELPFKKEIIIIDDKSTDDTVEIVRELQEKNPTIKVFYHSRNRGKGAALRTGFAHVTGQIVIIQDADLEYDPRDYVRLIRPILEGKADVVYGSRFLGESQRVLYFWHYLGNKCLTLLSNMMSNLNLNVLQGFQI
jgi:glycosyltransferase involved in cell wall biosynthesis